MQRRTKRTLRYSELEVVFATVSPRRRLLAQKIKFVDPDPETKRRLATLGVSRIYPIFMPSNVEERVLSDAATTATANARLKGEWAMAHCDKPVLAFDTVVGMDGRIFGKPKSAEEAIAMFKALCGATHEVVTAVFSACKGKIIEKTQKTYVTFGAFDADLVYNYVESGAPFDKAGGYNIDDAAIRPLITSVDGDYYNVVGMPLELTEKLIEENILYGEDGYSA